MTDYQEYSNYSWLQLVEMIMELKARVRRLEERDASSLDSKYPTDQPKVQYLVSGGYRGPYPLIKRPKKYYW